MSLLLNPGPKRTKELSRYMCWGRRQIGNLIILTAGKVLHHTFKAAVLKVFISAEGSSQIKYAVKFGKSPQSPVSPLTPNEIGNNAKLGTKQNLQTPSSKFKKKS